MRESNKLLKYFFIISLFQFFVTGCTLKEQVKVDLDGFLQDPVSYKDKHVIIIATVNDILERYDKYRDKAVEVTAPVSFYGTKGYWTWYLTLEQNGKKLRCFTSKYRLRPDRRAINLLMRLEKSKEELTVTGILLKSGLDLKTLYANGKFVRTDYQPAFPYPYSYDGLYLY